jgi:hypothetical protein
MSLGRLTFFRRSEPDEDRSVKASLNLADWGVKSGSLPDEGDPDPLSAFGSERAAEPLVRPPVPAAPPPAPRVWYPDRVPPRTRLVGLILLVLVVGPALVATFIWGSGSLSAPPAAPPVDPVGGRAVINSNPPGAQVFVNGENRGTTPLDIVLPVGVHTLQMQQGAALRTLPIEIAPNQITSQYVELPAEPAAALPEPPAPAPARNTAPTPSRPTASAPVAASPPASSQLAQRVAPTTRTPAPAAAPSPRPPAALPDGWIAFDSPFPVEVSEGGRALGTTAGGPLRLAAGLHTLELTNPTFEFRTTLAINVTPGQKATTPLTVPNGSLSVNALPWAEVFVDGRAIGMTPLAHIPVPIGSRELLWRHPELGERRQVIRVTARTPVRIGLDFHRAP